MGNDFFEVGEAESIPVPIANTFFNQGIIRYNKYGKRF